MMKTNLSVKAKLLQMLRRAGAEGVSGETAGAELKLSRVSIWRHINKMQEMGYDIRSTPTGYILENSPDKLYSLEFPGFEDRIRHYDTVDSTMQAARKLAREGCPPLTVVIAEEQTKGRGRLARNWQATSGGIYMTVVLRPNLPALLACKAVFLVSLSLAEVLNETFGIKAQTKWPNDVLIDDRKLAGILSEMEAEDDMASFVNVGIGLNFNNDISHVDKPAVRLADCFKEPVSRKEFLTAFLQKLETECENTDWDTIIPRWKAYTMTLNRRVKIIAGAQEREGLAVDIDSGGALLLRQDDGRTETVFYGDCFFMQS